MFTAQHADDPARSDTGSHGLADTPGHAFGAAHMGFQGRQRVDTQLGHVQVELKIVIFHLGGGGDDASGAVAGAAAVGGGAVVGNRKQDDAGGLESRLLGRQGQEVGVNP